MYEPEQNETIYLTAGVKVKADDLLAQQKLELEKFDLQTEIDNGRFHHINKNMIPSSSYYLVFGVKKDGIPLLNSEEPMVASASEDDIVKNTYIEVFVGQNEIQSINVSGAYSLSEEKKQPLISVQKASETLKKKYDMQILSSMNTVKKIWLEYVYVADTDSDDMNQNGEFIPYWCFENVTEEDPKESNATRINAFTGGDLAYGD